MLGAIRRRVASGHPFATASRSLASRSRLPSIADKEVLHCQEFGTLRGFCHFIHARGLVNSRPLREIIVISQNDLAFRKLVRSYSSDSGDLVDVVVPSMGESISDGTLAKFLKNPGDHVEADEPIAQIETDKVTIDVASPESGVIQKFIFKEGDTVEPGNKIAVISKSGEGIKHVAPSEKIEEKAASQPSSTVEKVEEKKQEAKAATASAVEKLRAPAPGRTATEPILPPKDRERRVRLRF